MRGDARVAAVPVSGQLAEDMLLWPRVAEEAKRKRTSVGSGEPAPCDYIVMAVPQGDGYRVAQALVNGHMAYGWTLGEAPE